MLATGVCGFVARIDAHRVDGRSIDRVLGHAFGASRARAAEHLAGRRCANFALASLGAPRLLGGKPGAAPEWPPGFVGSIAHAHAVAWAVVARSDAYLSVGVDVEPLFESAVASELSALVLRDDERDSIGADPRRLTLAYGAKECLYKCLVPLAGTPFDFGAARLCAIDLRGAFRIETARAIGDFPAGLTLNGQFALTGDHLFASVALRADDAPALRPPSEPAPR